MDLEHAEYEALSNTLDQHPTADTLGLVVAPRAHYPDPAMVFLMAPKIKRIVVYDSNRRSYFVNDLNGFKPRDGYDALADAQAFNWTIPLSFPDALRLIAYGNSVWIGFSNEGTKTLSSPPGTTPSFQAEASMR